MMIDNVVDLAIWDITEPAVSMVGSCVPVLRVLVQDMRSSGRHYPTTEDPSQLLDPTWRGWKFDDEGSEKGIFRTQEAAVEST